MTLLSTFRVTSVVECSSSYLRYKHSWYSKYKGIIHLTCKHQALQFYIVHLINIISKNAYKTMVTIIIIIIIIKTIKKEYNRKSFRLLHWYRFFETPFRLCMYVYKRKEKRKRTWHSLYVSQCYSLTVPLNRTSIFIASGMVRARNKYL